MSLIIPANSASASGGFNVANSLRLGGSNESLSFSESTTPTGLTKFTLSTWVKRSKLGSDQVIMYNAKDGSNFAQIYFRGSQKDIRYFDRVGGGDTCVGTTDMLFNDVGAFYHIVLRVDTTLGTAGDRVRIYVNGNEVAFTFDNTPSQNQALTLNNTGTKYIGVDSSGGNYFGGYHSEFCWIDGSSLAPDQFGEFDEDSGIWKPIDVSGLTFGNNGFYLNFETAAELGTDVSGNSNTFTESNLTAIDQSTDTCTNNFATMNPLNAHNATTIAGISEGNLSVGGSPSDGGVTSTIGVSSGKWYWEKKVITGANTAPVTGVLNTLGANSVKVSNTQSRTSGSGFWGFYNNTGSGNGIMENGSASGRFIDSLYSNNDIAMFAIDVDAQKIWYGKNGTWFSSGNPATGANASSTNLTANDTWFPYRENRSGYTSIFNFGSPPYAISSGNQDGDGFGNFEYAVPSGYFALNTKNLAEYG